MIDELFGWGQFIGSIATAGALFVLIYQTILTQKQMNATLRPWIGIVDEKSPWYPDVNTGWWDVIRVYLKNYGDIPPISCNIRNIITADKIRRKDILALKPIEGHVIMPQSEQRWGITNDDEVPVPMTDADQFFVGFSMEYVYGNNKKGLCGFIGRYYPSINYTEYEDYWLS
jgi:hypothetical protein